MASEMTTEDVLAVFESAGAVLHGHFILTSGLRSPVFLQKARVFMHPDKTEILCRALADKIKAAGLGQIDYVVGPAVGETVESLRALGAEVLAAGCLIDRSAGKADVGVPLVALAEYEVPAYPADKLPPELAAIPAVKPGSRGL